MFCGSTNQKAFKWEGKSKRNGKKFFLDKEIHFRFCVCVCLISCVLPDHHISSSHFHIHVILQCYFMNHSESFAFSSKYCIEIKSRDEKSYRRIHSFRKEFDSAYHNKTAISFGYSLIWNTTF